MEADRRMKELDREVKVVEVCLAPSFSKHGFSMYIPKKTCWQCLCKNKPPPPFLLPAPVIDVVRSLVSVCSAHTRGG